MWRHKVGLEVSVLIFQFTDYLAVTCKNCKSSISILAEVIKILLRVYFNSARIIIFVVLS